MKITSKFVNKYINLKIGLIGALIMGGIVFIINLEHGWFLSTTAGLKQGLYTFFFGGIIIKLLEHLLLQIKNPYMAISLSVSVISVFTSLLVFLVHSLKGTPEPFLSTVPTILMAPPGFLVLAIKFRREQHK
ncbi:MAG: hypothetical protein KAK04_11800 [Cyclobacteriaceae bacterium]|nr:hypothetical protein [Cyclobacteriaceae bacterium]